jgi:hypothetical protein
VRARAQTLTPFAAAFAALLLGVFGLPQIPIADAQRGLRCQVLVTQSRIRRGLSEGQLIRFARSHRTRRLQETDEEELNDRRWRAQVVFAFNRPPGDLEFHALYYEREGATRNFVREQSVFIGDRSQRTILHRISLPRPTFEPEQEIEMVVTVRRQEVGTARFTLVGERHRYSGEVDFTGGEGGSVLPPGTPR